MHRRLAGWRPTLLMNALILAGAGPALADEFALDLGAASSEVTTGWGAAAHGQWLFSPRWGLDLGYRYLNEIEYEHQGETLSHPFGQLESGLIWQQGNSGARFQAVGGLIMAGYGVETDAGDSVVEAFTPGYRLDADISVPLFTRFRAFASGGYQGYFDGGMPDQWRWRYGLRVTFGSQVSPLERDELARRALREAQAERARTDPPARIDPQVPEYMPRHTSQSLPPIVELSEVCKCFPAGPYTLQLGEFPAMAQAVRALEFRGLRQFFNTVAYERDPQPVFLGQFDTDGPVGFYLGEYQTLTETDHWRRQLRRNGIQARVRRVTGGGGVRQPNEVFTSEAVERSDQETYSREEIARMNSLPGDAPEVPDRAELNSPDEAAGGPDRAALNRAEDKPPERLDATLVVGPVAGDQLEDWLAEPAFRDVLLGLGSAAIPGRQRLIWDAAQAHGWLYLDDFERPAQLDQWRAWLEKRDLSVQRRDDARLPVGDIYVYTLGRALAAHSLTLDRQSSARAMLASMVSPQVLWFQAYQAINDQPVELVVNFSGDAGYQLSASGFGGKAEARRAWRHLSSVGVMPALD